MSKAVTNSVASFKNYESSVSDAWNVDESMIPSIFSSITSSISSDSSNMSNHLETSSRLQTSISIPKAKKLKKLLENTALELDMEELRRLAWSGLCPETRNKTWRLLCGYLPGVNARSDEVVGRKREEYQRYVDQYFSTRSEEIHQDTYRQIHIDIPRMTPVVGLFQQKLVQEMFERILYIWAIRHPASGYVQGINDLVTPFFLVFLHAYLKQGTDYLSNTIDLEKDLSSEERDIVEADSYWCLAKVLDGIQDYYTFAQPGIQLKVKQLEELIRRIDEELHTHLASKDVLFLQFSFRWMNNLLMREIPIKATIRLWDTYLAEKNGFSHFHLYVTAAFLMRFKSEIMMRKDFHTILMFLQNLPTAKWGNTEIDLLVAEAYKLNYLFAGAPNHLNGTLSTA